MADEINTEEYTGAFHLIDPAASGSYTFAIATLPEPINAPCIVLLIETATSSERHFWPLQLGAHMHDMLGQLLESATGPEYAAVRSGLQIAHALPDGGPRSV